MTPKLKKVLALVLVVLVGVVWIPQIISANAKSSAPGAREVPALGNAGAQAPSTSGASTQNGGGAQVAAGAFAGEASADREDLAHALEASVARAKLVAAGTSGIDLSELASAWSASTAVPAPAPVTPTPNLALDRTQAAAPATPVQVERASKPDPIDAFLATHPLRGTLIGATRRIACLGPLLVAVGDEPVKGLVVSAIEPRCVTFTRAGESVRVDLIPFQARAPSTAATTSHAGATTTSGATAAARPTGPSAGNELENLLPLLKQAADAANAPSASDGAKDKPPAPNGGSKDKRPASTGGAKDSHGS